MSALLPAKPAIDAMLMILRALPGIMLCLPIAWLIRKIERTLRFITLSHASSGYPRRPHPRPRRRLLTRMTTWPSRASAS
jgi:hypothetical protein